MLQQLEAFCAFFTPRLEKLVNKAYTFSEHTPIRSLTVLTDPELDALPFEHLHVFKDIKAKSKDFSLYQLAEKFRQRDKDPNFESSS